jgi:hypothetical protein
LQKEHFMQQFKTSSSVMNAYARQFVVSDSRIEATNISSFQPLLSGEGFQWTSRRDCWVIDWEM